VYVTVTGRRVPRGVEKTTRLHLEPGDVERWTLAEAVTLGVLLAEAAQARMHNLETDPKRQTQRTLLVRHEQHQLGTPDEIGTMLHLLRVAENAAGIRPHEHRNRLTSSMRAQLTLARTHAAAQGVTLK